MRIIPATMATQHPDNALPPFWDGKSGAFIASHREVPEALVCFKDLGVSEYMWDWEGKNADAAVIDRLFSEYYDYFAAQQLGKDKFLTFRIPNVWQEKGYNLLQAMSVILSGEDFARDLKFRNRPLFEVILPMTERAQQVLHMQTLFERLAKFKSKDFTPDRPANRSYLELIPLVESVESQLQVGSLLANYLQLHQRHFGHKPPYLRVFLACSDSALSSGFLAGMLGNKLGLARLYEFAAQNDLSIFPILGSGGLRFRGGLTPNTIDRFMQELPGVRTATLQSSFRYDHPKTKVKAAIVRLESELPRVKPISVAPTAQKQLVGICRGASELYKQTLDNLIADMKPFFDAVPKRRERRQHIGLLAYSRALGQKSLPRAITFTAGFYSVGVPPEFIGTGRALKCLGSVELQQLRDIYPNLKADFKDIGHYLNRQNLQQLAKRNPAWHSIEEDVAALEDLLGIKFQPRTKDHLGHHRFSSMLLLAGSIQERSELITKMAALRHSLG